MKFLKGFYISCWPLTIPLTILAIANVLFFTTHLSINSLTLVSWALVFLSLIFAIIYIVIKDSKFL